MDNLGLSTPSQNDKVLAAVSYLWFLSIVMLVVKKESDFIQFHARQGLVLFLASIVIWILPLLNVLLYWAYVVLVIIGMVQALGGNRWRIPYVIRLADKIKL